MKEHIETITDLLLGAAYADKRLEGNEIETIRGLLCKLLGVESLPASQADQIANFRPAKFDAENAGASLRDLGDDRRKVLEMIAAVHDADDEFDFDEDRYLQSVGRGLGLKPEQYADLTAQMQVDDLDGALT
jgi:uncharacterized tellurite resistance protein B-like protein